MKVLSCVEPFPDTVILEPLNEKDNFVWFEVSSIHIWDKVIKNGPSKNCGRHIIVNWYGLF